MTTFTSLFELLTGHPPFPWQKALVAELVEGRFSSSYDIPTGLGKTSVITVWLLALAERAARGTLDGFPRRLIYVVNRRTVVDQATEEAQRVREALRKPELQIVADALRSLAAVPSPDPVAISTLRGELADNAEWRMDPARPAIVLGTVDMIGSRLLFSGYGCGFRTKPLHAGFIGQDSWIIHDEAHLEPAFQTLLESVRREQEAADPKPIRVSALTATSRSTNPADAFRLTDADRDDAVVGARIRARKGMAFCPVPDPKSIADAVAEHALAFKDSGQAILVFVRKLDDLDRVVRALARAKQEPEVLTGTMRGLERERLVTFSDRFARFSVRKNSHRHEHEGTVYLVCTSAGEVGIDMSADHMVCDLTPFDSMAQRLGRVNRLGRGGALVDVVTAPGDADDPYNVQCQRTLALLGRLPVRSDGRRDASPAALEELPPAARLDAFSPRGTIVPTTEILFDAWSLTTVRERMPGRPPVADWLHGVKPWEPPETWIGWRDEVDFVSGPLLDQHAPEDLLELFPLKPHELLKERADRALVKLSKLAERRQEARAWIVGEEGTVESTTLGEIAGLDEDDIAERTILLPPSAGGLRNGLFDPADDSPAVDVSDRWLDEDGAIRRCRVWDEGIDDGQMRLVRTIDTCPDADESGDDVEGRRFWNWYVRARSLQDEPSRLGMAQPLEGHNQAAAVFAARFGDHLRLTTIEASAVVFAARHHDIGKNRTVWQRSIWNADLGRPLAKSPHRRPPRDLGGYRHEFGSLLDAAATEEFGTLDGEAQDLALHLIAAHHGRARPHFPPAAAFDPERTEDVALAAARETPRRFARLQRKYGRWGLAYLESLVRAADALASSSDLAIEMAIVGLDQPGRGRR